MTAILDKVTDEAMTLPQRERAKLAHALIISMDETQEDVPAAWDQEIKRRVDEIRSGKVKGIPAEDVFAKLRKKYH